jgi:hypothetical protein
VVILKSTDKLKRFVSEIEKTDIPTPVTDMESLTVRLPVHDMAYIQGLAKLSGITRNKIISNLVDISLRQVLETLSSENRETVDQFFHAYMSDYDPVEHSIQEHLRQVEDAEEEQEEKLQSQIDAHIESRGF